MCSYVFSMQNYPLLVMLGRIPKIMDGKWNASTKQIAQQRSTKPHVQNTSQIVLVTCVSMRSGCLHTLCHPFQHQQIGGCGPCGDLFQRRDWSLPWKWTQLHGSGPPRLFCGGHVPRGGYFPHFSTAFLVTRAKDLPFQEKAAPTSDTATNGDQLPSRNQRVPRLQLNI